MAARDADSFVSDHPDFLLVTAADDGGSAATISRGSPADAKNMLVVSAARNAPDTYPMYPNAEADLGLKIVGVGVSHALVGLRYRVVPALFGARFRVSSPMVAALALAEPEDACVELEEPARMQGKVAMVWMGGGCDALSKVRNAQQV